VFQSVSRSGNTATLKWSATVGQRYRLQFRTDLSSGIWNNVGAFVTATSTNMTGSDPGASTSPRFYRVEFFPTP